MNERDLARLLVKIAGLFIMAWTLTILPYQASSALHLALRSPRRSDWEILMLPEFWGVTIIPGLISLGIGLGLFWGSSRIVNRSVVPGQHDGARKGTDLLLVEEIAVVVLGFYFLAGGLGETIAHASVILSSGIQTGDWRLSPVSLLFQIVGDGAQLVIGIALILGGRAFVTIRRGLTALRPMARDR